MVGIEHAYQAFVSGEQIGDYARRREIDAEQTPGDVSHFAKPAGHRHVDAMIVPGRQVEGDETAALEGGCAPMVTTEQGME